MQSIIFQACLHPSEYTMSYVTCVLHSEWCFVAPLFLFIFYFFSFLISHRNCCKLLLLFKCPNFTLGSSLSALSWALPLAFFPIGVHYRFRQPCSSPRGHVFFPSFISINISSLIPLVFFFLLVSSPQF